MLKAGYGEPWRRFFARNSVFEQILDFGHAPIFENADVFPCIISIRKPVAQASSLHNDPVTDAGGRQDACPTEKMMPKNTSLRITRRRLPHWEMDGAVYFITFNTWERLELNEAARKTVLDSCQFFDNQRYVTFAIVVMPDHVHWLVQPLPKPTGEFWSLSEIMHSIKSYSAKQIPKVMAHIGTVWQIEWFDRLVRDETEFQNTWEYIRQNPVQAGLSNAPEAYPFLWEMIDRPNESAFSPVESAFSPVAQASSLLNSKF